MKICQDCGAEVEDSLLVCPQCGYKFTNNEEKIQRINERFQYDMQTIKKEFATSVLSTYADTGWKLHTAIDEGTELLFIFERKIKTNAQVIEDIDAELQKEAELRSIEIQNAVEFERTDFVTKKERIYESIVAVLKEYPEGCNVNALNDVLENKFNVMDLLVYLKSLAEMNVVINDDGKWKCV